jgi:hypothetical protein
LWEEFETLKPEGARLLLELSLAVEERDILLTEEAPEEILEQALHDLTNLQVALEKQLKDIYLRTTSWHPDQ